MAIGPIHIEWLSRLARKGLFHNQMSLLDLGPQDVQCPRSYLTEVAGRHLGIEAVAPAISGVFDGDSPIPTGQAAFYSMFGVEKYVSVDLLDERATYNCNLNEPLPDIGRFDVITNFGTAEHVFDIAEAFKSMHRLAKPGGILLHCMPVFGFVDHGFYNVHPVFFIELAKANNYEILDFAYVDDMFVRHFAHESGEFDFDSLPVKLSDTENTQLLMTKIVDTFIRNCTTTTLEQVHGYSGFHFDLLFVALKLSSDSPEELVPAIQGSFG